MRIGRVEATIHAGRYGGDDLAIEVEPRNSEISQDLFGAFENWASDIEAPKWQQKWVSLKVFFGVLLAFCLFFGLISIPLVYSTTAGNDAMKAEARTLLAQGVTSANELHAIALLLSIESDYNVPEGQAPSLGFRYWSYFSIVVLLLGAAYVSPKLSIGIWKGKKRLQGWRLWIRAVSVSIPLLILSSVLLPWIIHWMHLSPPSP
jgi:hypothetical protein